MKICIYTVIKDELDEYLKPWLEHHTKMVDHIFIIEDIGSHSHKHITDKYDNVTLCSALDIYYDEKDKEKALNRKGGVKQRFYLMDGVLKIQALNEYDWCFTLDIDEFITLEEPYKAISDVLSEFQQYDFVVLQWMNFGANGRLYKPDYNGIDYREFYTKRGNDSKADAALCTNTKVCWNLHTITKWNLCGVHCGVGDWVKTNFKKNRRCDSFEKMYLKHYITRSFEEYLWKIHTRGMHCLDHHRKIDDFFQINDDMLPMYDECMKFKEEYINNK